MAASDSHSQDSGEPQKLPELASNATIFGGIVAFPATQFRAVKADHSSKALIFRGIVASPGTQFRAVKADHSSKALILSPLIACLTAPVLADGATLSQNYLIVASHGRNAYCEYSHHDSEEEDLFWMDHSRMEVQMFWI